MGQKRRAAQDRRAARKAAELSGAEAWVLRRVKAREARRADERALRDAHRRDYLNLFNLDLDELIRNGEQDVLEEYDERLVNEPVSEWRTEYIRQAKRNKKGVNDDDNNKAAETG